MVIPILRVNELIRRGVRSARARSEVKTHYSTMYHGRGGGGFEVALLSLMI
jgi:hypothetical protein